MALHVLHNPSRAPDLLAVASEGDAILILACEEGANPGEAYGLLASPARVYQLLPDHPSPDSPHEHSAKPLDYLGWVALTEAHPQQVDWR